MTSNRKKPGLAFWATVVVVVALVAYPLRCGPACWLVSRTRIGESALPVIFHPMTALMKIADSPADLMRRLATASGVTPTGEVFQTTSFFFYPRGYVSKWANLGAAENWNWRFEVPVESSPDPVARMDEGRWKWFRDGR